MLSAATEPLRCFYLGTNVVFFVISPRIEFYILSAFRTLEVAKIVFKMYVEECFSRFSRIFFFTVLFAIKKLYSFQCRRMFSAPKKWSCSTKRFFAVFSEKLDFLEKHFNRKIYSVSFVIKKGYIRFCRKTLSYWAKNWSYRYPE